MNKYIVFLAVVIGGYVYVSRHYEPHDLLVAAKKNPGASWAPAVDYYAGLAYFQRAEYGKCQEAFTQLLTDAPTSQYVEKGLIRQEDCAEYNHDWETAKAAAAAYLEQFPQGKERELMTKRLELVKYNHP